MSARLTGRSRALAAIPPRSGVMDVKRAERVAREHVAEQRRAAPLPESGSVDGMDIRLGDFREVLADLHDVDAVRGLMSYCHHVGLHPDQATRGPSAG